MDRKKDTALGTFADPQRLRTSFSIQEGRDNPAHPVGLARRLALQNHSIPPLHPFPIFFLFLLENGSLEAKLNRVWRCRLDHRP